MYLISFQEDVSTKPQLDLAFKEGQTIKVGKGAFRFLEFRPYFPQVNINIPKSEKARSRGKGGGGILPPPPGVGAIKAPPPPASAAPGASSLTPLSSPVSNSVDLLGGLDLSPLSISSNPPLANLPQPASTQSKYAPAALLSRSSPPLLPQPYVSGPMTHGVPLRVLK